MRKRFRRKTIVEGVDWEKSDILQGCRDLLIEMDGCVCASCLIHLRGGNKQKVSLIVGENSQILITWTFLSWVFAMMNPIRNLKGLYRSLLEQKLEWFFCNLKKKILRLISYKTLLAALTMQKCLDSCKTVISSGRCIAGRICNQSF